MYTDIPDDEDGKKKREETAKIASDQYLAAVAFTRLDSRRHGGCKLDVKNTYVKTRVDILPESIVSLLKLVQTYKEPVNRGARMFTDPKHPGITMVKAGDKRYSERRPDATKNGDNITGIKNKARTEGCNVCGAHNYWKATYPHKNASEDKLTNIRARNAATPQLLKVGSTDQGLEGAGQDVDEDCWEGMEGVALVSPTAG